jgi:hypothetical protein
MKMSKLRKGRISRDNQQTAKIAQQLAESMFAAIENHKAFGGEEYARDIVVRLIERIVGTEIYNSLAQPVKTTSKTEQYEAVTKNFIRTKMELQEAIALGFSTGASAFSGRLLDYYCQISTVPEQVNKLPC